MISMKFFKFFSIIQIPLYNAFFIPHIHSKISLSSRKKKYNNEESFDIVHRPQKTMKYKYKPRSVLQELYNNEIKNDNIPLVLVSGPAGTGKTLFPTQYAAKLLLETDMKIVLTRPIVSVDEELGFLPGDINEKMHPWIVPIFDILSEFILPQKIEKYIQEKRIEIVPLAFMRGRTFKNTFIIGDELQNASVKQMLMLITRVGENSKMIITGDIQQCDTNENGLFDLIQRFESYYHEKDFKFLQKDNISFIKLGINDVQRSYLVSTILNIYNN